MAKENDKDLKAANEKEEEVLSKEEQKAKKDNEKHSLKVAASKKPKKSIAKFYKDARAEFKKVVWPAPKQVANNTFVVLAALVVASLAIWALDSVFNFGLRTLLNMQ
ncbi:MAG: preprotein translocase subunit SecE [Eubacterium sp.]|jgi:preprotein translocase subunit SecE|nr:preprotein translocase subunit SecE [Eubacterium sp.]